MGEQKETMSERANGPMRWTTMDCKRDGFCGEPSQGTSDEQEGELSNEPAVGALLLTHHGYAS